MEKKYELLSYLIDKKDSVTNAKLQNLLNISRRTVINYVNQLNKEAGDIIVSTSNGYKINNLSVANNFLNKVSNTIPNDYESRKMYLFKIILFMQKAPTLDEIANDLCISINTLNVTLNRLKKELKELNLYIRIKNNRIYLIGDNKEKQHYTMQLLNTELENRSFSMQYIQDFFTHVNIKKIENIVQSTIQKHGFFIDDFSCLNYILHLAICIDSSVNAKDNQIYQNNYILDAHSHKIVEEIYQKLKSVYDYNYTFDQLCDASILMSTRIVSKDIDKVTIENMDHYIGSEVKELIFEIVDYIHEYYGINLKNDNFMIRFSIHLKNALHRAKNDIEIPANDFITIQNNYPFLYVMAVSIASIISNKINKKLSQSEISYIALHLGVLMEEKKTYDTNINCVLVIYDYYNTGKVIFNQISQRTSGLYLTDIVSDYSKINLNNEVDLILTTLPLDYSINIPMIKINMIPSKEDLQNIDKIANEIKENLLDKQIIWNIKKLFKKKLFFVDTNFKNYNDALDFACSKVEKLAYVNDEFRNAIFEHENFVPSAYQNLAIPHPLSDNSGTIKVSSISVIINKEPIQWFNNSVDFVFMLSLKSEDRLIFKEIFDLLIRLTDKEIMQRLKQVKTYEEFINLLLENRQFL